ncbi:MAG: hypothetical protein JW697_01400 [Kosmotogaceae bacterium]|nr:hypothetical protein [Kosmotogaceae bacterium]
MGFFEGFSKIVFVISYALWAGGGLMVSLLMLPMKDPRTEPQVQGYLYTFWQTIRIMAAALSFVVLGAAIAMAIIVSASLLWSLMFTLSWFLTFLFWFMADRFMKAGGSDPRSMVEVHKRSFHGYLVMADISIFFSMLSIAFLLL